MTGHTINFSLPYPEGNDRVATHTDIEKAAKSIDSAMDRVAWNRGEPGSMDMDTLRDGSYRVPTGAISGDLGLPTGLTGELEKIFLDQNGITAVAKWSPRTRIPQQWASIRNSDGWTPWSRMDNREPSPASFGAVGDGVADDTEAMRAWLAYLASTGTNGVLDPATYRITGGIGVVDQPKPFRITGAGIRQSRIILDADEPSTVFQVRGAVGVQLSDFHVSGASKSRPCSHGIAISDSVDSTVSRVRVSLYYSTAVIFFRYTAGAASERNRIVDCLAEGGGIARNGFMLENCRYSWIVNCTVVSLSRTETPSYGLQLKNDCRECVISGGEVVNALAGVAFGSDTDEVAGRSHVLGVTARGCKWGFIASRTSIATVDMLIDHSGAPEGGHPARIGARCSGVALNLTVRNVPPDVPVAYIGSSNNSVRLAPMQNPPEHLVHFVPLLVGTTVIYEGRESDATVLDESGDPSNHIVGMVGGVQDALDAYIDEIGS